MGGYSSLIQLSADGDVVGQGESFVEVSIDPNPTQGHSCDVTLLAGNDVEPGTYTITFEGVVDLLHKYFMLELTVIEKLFILFYRK